MLSSEFFHVVKDEQTPLAHASADVPPAAMLVVGLPPPPPQAAAESTSTATAAPPRRRDDIAYIRSARPAGHQDARTSPAGWRASLRNRARRPRSHDLARRRAEAAHHLE